MHLRMNNNAIAVELSDLVLKKSVPNTEGILWSLMNIKIIL